MIQKGPQSEEKGTGTWKGICWDRLCALEARRWSSAHQWKTCYPVQMGVVCTPHFTDKATGTEMQSQSKERGAQDLNQDIGSRICSWQSTCPRPPAPRWADRGCPVGLTTQLDANLLRTACVFCTLHRTPRLRTLCFLAQMSEETSRREP